MKKVIILTLLFTLSIFIVFTNQTNYIHITILDMNDSFKSAMNLYVKRFNKYGGIDNHILKIDEYADSKTIATIHLKPTTKITIDNKSFIIDKSLGLNHLNYRISATVSDSKRQNKPLPTHSTLNKLKALDLIIECLPLNISNVADTKKIVIEKLKQHHYFKATVNSKINCNVGIAMNKISNIDIYNFTYDMDFFIWFKWNKNLHNTIAYDIEFINTVSATTLLVGDESVLNSIVIDSSPKFILFRVKGKFKAVDFKNYALGEQNLPILFRHKNANLSKIHYSFDNNDISDGIFSQNIESFKNMEKLKFNVIDNPSFKLNYTLHYSTFVNKMYMGNHIYNDIFSQFNYRYAIKSTDTSLRGFQNYVNRLLTSFSNSQISINNMLVYIFFSLLVSIILTYYRRNKLNHGTATNIIWVVNLMVMMLMVLCIEFLLSQILFNVKNSQFGISNIDEVQYTMNALQMIISLAWWFIPAYYINSGVNEFVWRAIEIKTKQSIPKVLKLFISLILYTLAFIGVLAFVFNVTTSSLMATSGVFAILFAILSKVDISNIVAGLGISFSKAFKIGDWLSIGDEVGKVIEMNARSTKLRTLDNSIISIPNTIVASNKIENYSKLNAIRQMIHLEVVPADIAFIRKVLLDSVTETIGVLHVPQPFIQFKGQGDSAQIYECYYFIKDYGVGAVTYNSVWWNIWNNCKDNNIIMSTPQREHFMYNMDKLS